MSSTKHGTGSGTTADLFADSRAGARRHADLLWPDADRFPLNLDRQRRVGEVLRADILDSARPLIVTGYAGLDELVDVAARYSCDGGHLRMLLGHEPFPSRQTEFRLARDAFPDEVRDYWLGHGISLLLSAKVVRFIDHLRAGRIEARYLADPGVRLHAKVYRGDEAASVGSSNFTRAGLDRQLEANARFTLRRDPRRFSELCRIAENYWSLGEDYRDALIDLLEALLNAVSWQEALARACAELLEGDWAKAYLEQQMPGASELWPSQRQGIAQALYILARQGSVLIADATGSGKTRMGSHLLRAVHDQLLRSGRIRDGVSLMVCPPTVSESWKDEAASSGAALDVYSHGILSRGGSQGHDRLVDGLRRAQVLCVDEGHNFLNVASQRTQHLLHNMADHVLVFTATPINRSVVDLLRIADLLGADNLEASTVETFKRMLGAGRLDRGLTTEEYDALRREIKRFTLRRTKRMLNGLIEQDPDAYRDREGERCRFPVHRPRIYTLDEPAADRALAEEVRELAGQLLGVTYFRKPLELPDVLRRQGWSEERYLASRLASAGKLARYIVMASLRSSRGALVEHIEGTAQARKLMKLSRYRRSSESGDMLRRLDAIAGKVAGHRLSVALPDWLTDVQAHRRACAHDRGIYAAILRRVAAMSSHREQRKARVLLECLHRHDLVLAFDSRPITLALMRQLVVEQGEDFQVLVATGDPGSDRSGLLRGFAPGSGRRRLLGLCSDSLAEGVNLQQASCIVHLDMPSVVRIAEQRVGRVDRMDSPHREIEAWWPDDAPAFALSTDERFIERYETVENLLGSNLPLPDAMHAGAGRVSAGELIEAFEREAQREQWDGLEDAFEPVRALVSGPDALVDPGTYAYYRKASVPVLSRVGLVRSVRPWAFFCLSTGAVGAPRWVFIPGPEAPPMTELDAVSGALRERLADAAEDVAMDANGQRWLTRFLGELARGERLLLSRRKQRAIDELIAVVGAYLDEAGRHSDQARFEQLRKLDRALSSNGDASQPDWDEVATRWLDLIRPAWYAKLKTQRKKPLLLREIRRDLIDDYHALAPRLLERFRSFPGLAPVDERVRACIIGIDGAGDA